MAETASKLNAPPNNGMHPTANSVVLMREAWPLSRLVAVGDAGRWALRIVYVTKWKRAVSYP